MPKKIIFLFARAPIKGKVKTRLAQTIGEQETVKMYDLFLRMSIKLMSEIDGVDKAITYWPKNTVYFDKYKKDFNFIFAQRGKTFIDRLKNSYKYFFNKGYDQVTYFASDSPDLPKYYLTDALKKLDSADCVLGRTEDGGYYCLGLSKKELIDEIFKIPHLRPDTAQNIVAYFKERKYKFDQVGEWYDIDNESDLKKFLKKNKSILKN